MLKEQSNKINNARHFVDFPVELAFFDEFADHLEDLEGAEITEFDVNGIVDMSLMFEYRENQFLIDIYFDDYRFFVEDAKCPEEILLEIIDHFRKLLPK
jgi:hypothetical protein